MGSYDASNSGFFLVTSAQVLHLGEQHPGQCSNDDSASDEHLHIRYRESPGRRDGYSLHGAPPYQQAESKSGISISVSSFHGLIYRCAAG
jgi:hypothetical protein